MWSRTHAPIPLVDPNKLQFCISNHLNVLLEGRHGVGKTTLVRKAFETARLNLLVFSGPTMDPWVDFVGVPRPITREDGKTVLELVRRPEFVDDNVDAIFIDEFNRAPAKVRNAALELLQFQSVNGHKFKKLRIVWAAVNPDDGDFDVERMDPAQLDRFHVRIDVPYRPCPNFFVGQFGSTGRAALEWWDAQSDQAKQKVSPRRLEYALRVALMGGPVRDVLPPECNVRKLLQMIEEGPVFDTLKDMLKRGDKTAARKLMQNPETGSQALRHVLSSKAASIFFLPLLDPERLMALLDNKSVLETVVKYSANVPEFHNLLAIVMDGNKQAPLYKNALASMKRHGVQLAKAQFALTAPEDDLDSDAIASLDPHGRLSS